ncbi:MAG: 50S ribosomal protein L31 [Clostridia bacterium]|nr:50S ribosomal protein L31 [Clostridia bacterium]
MKKDIQPNYVEVKFVCACGNEFMNKTAKVGVKEGDIVKLEVCDKCHPFFTGQQKLVDTEGRVDKFNKKFNLK